jgi:predicted O-methyltransferase YrrM
MLFKIKSFLKFIYNSKNEHGVHSPFVFDLLTKCFYDKKSYSAYAILSTYRKALLADKTRIEVADFGAGSKIFKTNLRPINKIAKTAGISKKRAQLLFRIVNYYKPQSILEIGTSLGLATAALSLGNPDSKISTLEGCANTLNKGKIQLQKFNFKNVETVHTEFSTFLKSSNPKLESYDLIYFDGNHSKQATLTYFELLLPTISNNSVWIFDDIHWSEAMETAWETIKKHPKVKVTIDTYQWGIVFFRAEQAKQHFVLRT